MPKYIDADKLVDDLRKYHRSRKNYGKSYETISREIYSIISKQSYADVEPKQRWIPVTDIEKLPKKSTPCLVACNQWGGEIVRKAIFLASENCFTERGIDITEYVTHWMESPKPPEEVYNV